VILGLVLALAATAADCKKCKDTGYIACPAAKEHACSGTRARYCSYAAACEACVGTARVPCAKCPPRDDAERVAEMERQRAWLAGWKESDDVLGRTLAHAESAHFRLTYDLGKLDVAGGETRHAGMHLYLERAEELFALVAADLGAAEGDFLGTTSIFLWAHVGDQEKASLHFTRQSSATESKLMGKAPVVSIFYDKAWLHEEFELHQALVHQLAHCLLSNVWDGIWPGNIGAGWIDEGLAHDYELDLFDGVRHYCYVETDTILDVKKGSWEPHVRTTLEAGKAPGFLGVAGKNTAALTPEDNYFAWSYVDWVKRAHPSQLGPLARRLKQKMPLKDALAETIGTTPFEFERDWAAFVKAEYALKKKKPR
jgi:hypothetical protein